MVIDRVPDYLDTVKHKKNDTVGVVNAIYTKGNDIYIDVIVNKHIKYESPIENWEVVIGAVEDA